MRFLQTAKAFVAIATAASLATLPGNALACTHVYVGPDLTASGDVLYGRSEDAANRQVKQFGIEPRTEGKTYWSGENGPEHDASLNFTRTSPGSTYRYTYVRDLPQDWNGAEKAYSEAGTNEMGVSVDATLTTAMNDAVAAIDPCPNNGIGEYNVTDVILSEASTAREGVELLGSIIDAQGSQDCNQIWIGDANEVWNFQQLSGHQWIAMRMADGVVSVNPNMSNLRFAANLDDPQSCLHSVDLVKVAQDAGTLVNNDDGTMDVAGSYGKPEAPSENTRYVQGHWYYDKSPEAGKDYTTDDKGRVETIADPQLCFVPSRDDYDLFDVQRSLATRGEGTTVDANNNPELYAIGNDTNVESHVFQTRFGLDPEIATVQWEALSRCEFSVYVPSYSALLTDVDTRLYPGLDDFDTAHVGNKDESGHEGAQEGVSPDELAAQNEALAMQDSGSEALTFVFMDLNTLAYNHRPTVAKGVRAYLDALQKEINTQQEKVDQMMRTTEAGPDRNDLANEAHAAASRLVFERCSVLLDELRDYLSAGDFSRQFAASDLGTDGNLVTPVDYASKLGVPDGTGATEETTDWFAYAAPALVAAVAVVLVCVRRRANRG